MQSNGSNGLLANITEFLSVPSNTISIKGLVGTGKTTLAVSLLSLLNGDRKGIYISTRVSYERLLQQYPWINQFLSPKDVMSIEVEDAQRAKYHDVRLADVKILLNIVFDVLSNNHNPLIVFDSWDSLAKEIDPVERLKAEKTLVSAIDASKANAIFISEEVESTSLDYLVDGVITLNSSLFDYLRFREIIVQKLRGKLVDKPVKPFTLRGGKFEELPEFHYSIANEPKQFPSLPDIDGHYSTGSRSVDMLLGGGPRKGAIFLVEITPDTSSKVLSSFVGLMILNFINNGNIAMIGLSKDLDEMTVKKQIQPYSKEDNMKNLRMKFSSLNQILTSYTKMKSEDKSNVLVVFDASYVDKIDCDSLLTLCGEVRKNEDLLVIVSDGTHKDFNKIKRLADIHAKFWQNQHYMLTKEVKAFTRLYAMDFSLVQGIPSLELIDVV